MLTYTYSCINIYIYIYSSIVYWPFIYVHVLAQAFVPPTTQTALAFATDYTRSCLLGDVNPTGNVGYVVVIMNYVIIGIYAELHVY